MKKRDTQIIILLVALLVMGSVVGVAPWDQLSILSVSRVYIDPQYGYDINSETGEVTGGYWVVTSTTHAYGDHVFYELDNDQVEKYGQNVIDGDEFHVEAKIQVDVKVGQPYVKRPLAKTPYTVSKPAYGYHEWIGGSDTKFREYYDYNYGSGSWVKKTDGPIPQQDIVVQETSSDWTAVVPLTVQAKKIDKDGSAVALVSGGHQTVSLEVSGPGALSPIWFENPNNPEERLQFKLEGMLNTGKIVTLPDMAVFREDIIFEKDSSLLNALRYSTDEDSYVSYWYERWEEHGDGSICVKPVPTTSAIVGKGTFTGGGWGHFYVYPVRMWLYGDPPLLKGKAYKGLVSHLSEKARRLEDWEIDAWGKGYSVGEDEIRIYAEYDTWLWLYTLEISTELADTYTWKPTYTDGAIAYAKWQSTSGMDTTISTQDVLQVKVKNIGTVDGNLRIRHRITPADAPLQIAGDGHFFKVNGEHVFECTAKNLGPEKETTGEIVIELVNDANDIRDTETVTFTLLPITGVTTVNVKLVEAWNPNKLLSGITVSVEYGSNSRTQISENGWASFQLGAYQGSVRVVAEESVNYYGASKHADVSTGGNVVQLELQSKGVTFPAFPYWLLAVAVGGVAVVWYYHKKRKG